MKKFYFTKSSGILLGGILSGGLGIISGAIRNVQSPADLLIHEWTLVGIGMGTLVYVLITWINGLRK